MKRVIIADDSSMARMFIRRCLEISGFGDTEFFEGSNGQDVLDLLKEKGQVDLIVTDLNMPEMNGMELLRRVKASPRFHHTPVLVITSTTSDEKVRQMEEMGALAVLSKPISPTALAPAISTLVETEEYSS